MLYRTIESFILAGIITAVISRLFNINAFDLIILALVLAPQALLQMNFNNLRNDSMYMGSIFFHKHTWLFRLFSLIMISAVFIGLYYYAKGNGVKRTIIYFLSASIIQAPYYALLKRKIPGEIVLIPVEIIGLILFYYFVV